MLHQCCVYDDESYALFEMLWKRETAGYTVRQASYLILVSLLAHLLPQYINIRGFN